MARTGRPPKDPQELKDFGQRVTELMTEKGITGRDLAKTLNAPDANISRYRSGKRQPAGKQLVELAKALGTTAEYLITG